MIRIGILVLVVCGIPHSVQAESPVDQAARLETISTEFGLADGPAWDGKGGLYIPDVKGQKLFRYVPETKTMDVVLDDVGRISASFFSHGRLYLSDNGESRIALLKGTEKVTLTQHDKAAKPAIRPNDLVVDSTGGVYYTLTGQHQVMYVTADGKRRVAVEKIDTPNGIILSPDGRTLYVSAYVPKEVWAYSVSDTGMVGAGKLFAVMDDGPEKGADGMTIDTQGNVYCAGARHVWIWAPDGKLLDRIETPTRPINCAFGDADQRSLYITGFGGLYRQRMSVSGANQVN